MSEVAVVARQAHCGLDSTCPAQALYQAPLPGHRCPSFWTTGRGACSQQLADPFSSTLEPEASVGPSSPARPACSFVMLSRRVRRPCMLHLPPHGGGSLGARGPAAQLCSKDTLTLGFAQPPPSFSGADFSVRFHLGQCGFREHQHHRLGGISTTDI